MAYDTLAPAFPCDRRTQKTVVFTSLEGCFQYAWLLIFLVNHWFVFILSEINFILIFIIENKSYLVECSEISPVTF